MSNPVKVTISLNKKPFAFRLLCAAITAMLVFAHGPLVAAADPPPPSAANSIYMNPKAPIEARVNDLFGRLTQAEKFSLLALEKPSALELNLPAIPRLGIPSLRTCDSAEGVRDGPSTVFPMEVLMASTWDPALIRRAGAVIGQEARVKQREVIYGPVVNIHRSPQSGRDFENFSEDPYLTSQMAVGYIKGMQGEGVASCIKHFAANNQEKYRHDINVEIDERTLREIELPGFEAAVKDAHVWSLMSAINKVNGSYMAENKPLLTDILRDQWHWDGVVISDWGAIHDTVGAVNGGTDVEMPKPSDYSPDALAGALKNKTITQAQIDTMVKRVIRLMVRTKMLDGALPPIPDAPTAAKLENTPLHQSVARKVAEEGITLLKNEGNLLPLDRTKIKSIAVIGPNAEQTQLGGRWSADVPSFYNISVLDGIKKLAGSEITVQFARGCPRLKSGKPAGLRAAVALARKSDVAIVVVGMDKTYEGEELDPPDLYLPGDQDKLIQAVAAANKHTIVVLNNGTQVLTEKWIDQVPGLLEMWYAGEEGGNALAEILFGEVNPSGHLPDTFAFRREDYSDWPNYPGTKETVKYAEGIYVGYRHFDKARIKPRFPFGYGLTYTTFALSDLKVPPTMAHDQPATISVTVKNTGKRAGADVVQLYIHCLAPKVDRPIRELKGFQRVSLNPGQSATVKFTIDDRSLSYWDIAHHRWQADRGPYAMEVGDNYRDIKASGVVRMK